MHLADPPMLSYFLFENPWPLSLSLAAVAIVLAWVARQRANGRLATGALVIILAALGVQVASTLVKTDREDILEQTQAFLDTTAPLSVDAFAARLDKRATVVRPSGPWLAGDEILAQLQQRAGTTVIRRQVILDIEAEMRGPNAARSLFDVRTESNLGSFPSRWMITWVRDAGGPWKVLTIEWLESDRVGAINPGFVGSQF